MASYTAVSWVEHAAKTWLRFDSYRIFAAEQTAPLVAAEFPQASVAFPIAWVENEGLYEPIALLGLTPAENLFVDSANRWIGTYVPAHFRTQPFRLIQTAHEQLTLGVREDIGLVTENDTGNSFFNENGDLSEEVRSVVNTLKKLERNRAATRRASQALSDAGVLERWGIAPLVNGERRPLVGLYRVSEQALNHTSARTLMRLRNTGALGPHRHPSFPMIGCGILGIRTRGLSEGFNGLFNRAQASGSAQAVATG